MLCEEIYKLLTQKIPNKNILKNEPMSKHTSFKIGGNAELFVKANDIQDVKFVLDICKKNNIPLTVVGNGSNLLVKDSGINGVVLKVNIDGISIEDYSVDKGKYQFNNQLLSDSLAKDMENNYVIVTVGAGVPLGKLAQVLLKNSISGFEFASGIPGTIGGAVRMNAGAYGYEFKDILIETVCINMDGEIFRLNNEQQKFGYRRSIFKDEKFVILESKLLLMRVDDSEQIRIKMNEHKKSRLENQPIEFPSAGSTFRRGEDFITAKLIDECGLKGITVGGAQVSTKHAGFIINKGGATAQDVLDLVDIIKENVLKKCGKVIELEVEVLG